MLHNRFKSIRETDQHRCIICLPTWAANAPTSFSASSKPTHIRANAHMQSRTHSSWPQLQVATALGLFLETYNTNAEVNGILQLANGPEEHGVHRSHLVRGAALLAACHHPRCADIPDQARPPLARTSPSSKASPTPILSMHTRDEFPQMGTGPSRRCRGWTRDEQKEPRQHPQSQENPKHGLDMPPRVRINPATP